MKDGADANSRAEHGNSRRQLKQEVLQIGAYVESAEHSKNTENVNQGVTFPSAAGVPKREKTPHSASHFSETSHPNAVTRSRIL
jgi:hypothetical protein